MARSNSPKMKALVQNSQRTWPHSSLCLSWQDDELPKEKQLSWRQPYKSQIFPESPPKASELPLFQSSSHLGLMVSKIFAHKQLWKKGSEAGQTASAACRKWAAWMQPAFLLKKRKKRKNFTKLKKHYCNPDLWEIKCTAKRNSICFA